MKRRELKKRINYLCGDLIAECITIYKWGAKEVSKEKVENIMKNILLMQKDLVERLSHVEPGSEKVFFKKLKNDMIDMTNEIIDQIKALA